MRTQAWPRLEDPRIDDHKRSLGEGFESIAFRAIELISAIAAGCLACRLLKEAIEYFQPVQDRVEGEIERDESHWVGYRKMDDAWLVALPNLIEEVWVRPKRAMVLEIMRAPGNASRLETVISC